MDLAELNKPPTEPEKAELLSALAPAPELQLIARRLCFQIDKLTRVAEAARDQARHFASQQLREALEALYGKKPVI